LENHTSVESIGQQIKPIKLREIKISNDNLTRITPEKPIVVILGLPFHCKTENQGKRIIGQGTLGW
jgi:hypothetical protein